MKALKLNCYKGTSTYRYGKWSVRVSRKTISERAGCGLRHNTSVCDWYAIDTENPSHVTAKSGYGGIRDAVSKLQLCPS